MNQAKFNIKFVLGRILLVAFISFFICNCCGSGKRNTTISAERYKFLPYISHANDSVSISAWLNDTIFKSEEIITFEDENFNYDSIEFYRNPRAYFCLKNYSSQDMLFRWYGISLRFYDPSSSYDCLGLILGQGNVNYNNLVISTGEDLPKDTNFVLIRAGDSLIYYDSLDVALKYEYSGLSPGRYWLQLVYRTSLWADTTFPIFIGELWSDTMWFRIEE